MRVKTVFSAALLACVAALCLILRALGEDGRAPREGEGHTRDAARARLHGRRARGGASREARARGGAHWVRTPCSSCSARSRASTRTTWTTSPAGEQPLLPDEPPPAGRDARHAAGRDRGAARDTVPAAPQPRGRDLDGPHVRPRRGARGLGRRRDWEAKEFRAFMRALPRAARTGRSAKRYSPRLSTCPRRPRRPTSPRASRRRPPRPPGSTDSSRR